MGEARAKQWLGSDGFGPKNVHPKKTEEHEKTPISVHLKIE